MGLAADNFVGFIPCGEIPNQLSQYTLLGFDSGRGFDSRRLHITENSPSGEFSVIREDR